MAVMLDGRHGSASQYNPFAVFGRPCRPSRSPAQCGQSRSPVCRCSNPSPSPLRWNPAQQSRFSRHEGAEWFWLSRVCASIFAAPGSARASTTTEMANWMTFEPRWIGWTANFTCRMVFAGILVWRGGGSARCLRRFPREGSDWTRPARGRRLTIALYDFGFLAILRQTEAIREWRSRSVRNAGAIREGGSNGLRTEEVDS